MSSNYEKIMRQFREKSGFISRDIALSILRETAQSLKEWVMNMEYTYQDQTYNLTDSTGFAIYENGVMIEFIAPPELSAMTRVITYRREKINIDGRSLLRDAINNMEIASLGQYVLGVYSAAPYGLWVDQSLGRGGDNKRGKGWFSTDLKEFALQEFERIKNEYINNK
ncbi:MAG: hypothetical protein IKY94_11545 [Lachnospiraceae bacterium]|nr:hypothetical protein [Lachnospiraceae bacterium]